MRLVFLSHVYPHPASGFNPGIERVIGELAPALACLGHDVHVLTSYRNGQAPKTEKHRGVTLHRVDDWRSRYGRMASVGSLDFRSLARTLVRDHAELIRTADAAHTFTQLPNWPFQTPLFAHYHHHDKPKRFIEHLFMHTADALWQKTYQLSHKVIAISKFSEAEFRTVYKRVNTPIEVVYNGINPSQFAAPKRSVPFGGRAPTILYVGPFYKRKGLDYLFQALPGLLETYPDLTLRLVGKGPEEAALKQLAETLGISSALEFLGFVSEEKLRELYARATLFVLPSLHEGFGIVLAEAMAAGLPVISTTSSAIPEVVGDDGILVPPKDVRALAEAITQMLSDSDKRCELAKRGQARALKHFTWHQSAQELETLYGQTSNI